MANKTYDVSTIATLSDFPLLIGETLRQREEHESQ